MRRSILRQVVNIIPTPVTSFVYRLFYFTRDYKGIKRCRRELSKYIEKDSDHNLSDRAIKNLKQYCIYMYRDGAEYFLASYFNSDDFKCIQKKLPNNIPSSDPILICCVKNDITRIKLVFDHHSKIGIKHFVFVDNGSSDGTLEYLLDKNVDVYQTMEKYHAGCKAAWTKKVEDIYGYHRWYLVVDSDELFSYVGMEDHLINEMIEYAVKNGISRLRSLLLDMYSNTPLFSETGALTSEDIVNKYRFFDSDTYYMTKDCKGPIMRGGPRKRIFETDSGHSQPLTKFPLICAEEEDIWADHTPFPFKKNFKSPCLSVLRHYKFLPEDLEKFKLIIQDGNYSNGSREYKTYMSRFEDDNSLTFWNEKSCEYIDSSSLKKISVLDEFQW